MDRIAADIAVLGGGEAGIAAVVQASEMGASVAVVERAAQLGGACVFTGTLPSKVFSISTSVFELMQKAEKFGIKTGGGLKLDYKEVLASRTRITRCDQGVIGAHLRRPNVKVVRGEAVLRDARRLAVRTPEGAEIEVEAPRLVLAAGSRPFQVPGLPTDGRVLLSTDDLVDMPDLPARMIIVGAGVIGCEYAFIFRTFGVDVVLIEKMERALPGQDKDIVAVIEKEMKRRGIRFLPGTVLRDYELDPQGRPVVTTDKGERIEADKVLVCVGRRPATSGLGLDAAGDRTGNEGRSRRRRPSPYVRSRDLRRGRHPGPLDAFGHGHPGGMCRGRERPRRRQGPRRALRPQRHLHPAGDRRRRPDRGGGPRGRARHRHRDLQLLGPGQGLRDLLLPCPG